MKRSSEYPVWELHPRKLTEEEVHNPYLVLDEFFDAASLPQVRDKLWGWLDTTVTSNYSKELSRKQRAHLLLFYCQVEKLVEAAHVLHTTKTTNSTQVKKPRSKKPAR